MNMYNYYIVSKFPQNVVGFNLLIFFCVCFAERRSCKDMGCSSGSSLFSCFKWAVPAFLYFLDNLIIFYVMTYLQPVSRPIFLRDMLLVKLLISCSYSVVRIIFERLFMYCSI